MIPQGYNSPGSDAGERLPVQAPGGRRPLQRGRDRLSPADVALRRVDVLEFRAGRGRRFPMSTMPLAREVYYPESDGRPMAETEAHGQVMIDLWTALRRRYASVPDVYAWGNMFLYYQQ